MAAGPGAFHYQWNTVAPANPPTDGGYGSGSLVIGQWGHWRRHPAACQALRNAGAELLEYTMPVADYPLVDPVRTGSPDQTSYYTGGSGSVYHPGPIPDPNIATDQWNGQTPRNWYWDPQNPFRVYDRVYGGLLMDMRVGSKWTTHLIEWYRGKMSDPAWQLDGWELDVIGTGYLGWVTGLSTTAEQNEYRAGCIDFLVRLRAALGPEVILIPNNTWLAPLPPGTINGIIIENHPTHEIGEYWEVQCTQHIPPLGRRRNFSINPTISETLQWAQTDYVDHAAAWGDHYQVAPLLPLVSAPYPSLNNRPWPGSANHFVGWDSTLALPDGPDPPDPEPEPEPEPSTGEWEFAGANDGIASGNSFTVPRGSFTNGDTIFVFVSSDTEHSIGSTPSGWAHHGTQTDSSSDSSTSLFSKSLTDTEPSSWTFGFTSNEFAAWGALGYRNLGDIVTPVPASSGSTATPTTGSITSVEANSLILVIAGSDPPGTITATTPSGWTERVNRTNSNYAFIYAIEKERPVPGTESATLSFSASDRYSTWILAAAPVPSGNTPVGVSIDIQWGIEEEPYLPEGGYWGVYSKPTRLPIPVHRDIDLDWNVSPQVSSATYYISPSGSDTTGNGSFGSPWRSVYRAYQMAQPGDIVQMASGNYPRHFGDSSSSPSNSYIQNAPAKNVGYTLPVTAGQSDDRWVSPPVKFVVSPGATVVTDAMRIEAGGIEFDGTGGNLYMGFISTKSTSRIVLRNCDFYGTTAANSYATFGFIGCRVGVGKPGDQDVYQTKADSSTPSIQPRQFYSRRTIWVSAYKPIGSSNHVDTIQIGGMDGLWFEESYVQSNSSPVRVQGFFAKGWTGPTTNAKVHNCWLEYTNISEPNTFVEFHNNRVEVPFNIDAGHGSHSGTTVESGGTLLSEFNSGGRPWL